MPENLRMEDKVRASRRQGSCDPPGQATSRVANRGCLNPTRGTC